MAAMRYSRELQLLESMIVAVAAGCVAVMAAIALGPRLASLTSTNVGGILSPIIVFGIGLAPIFLTRYVRHGERTQSGELRSRVEEENEYELFNKIDLDLAPVVGEEISA